jgi:hypothetical protein
MRPVDADALDNMLAGAQIECKRNGGNFMFGVLSTVRENIKMMPTVDTIPVEWMRDKMRSYASALQSTETAALVRVMQMWEDEQGART